MIAPQAREAAIEAYRALNDSPMQRQLRTEKRWYIGAVYWHPGDYDLDEMRRELTRMKELGFTIVRFHNHQPREVGPGIYDFGRTDDWLNIAAEVGLPVIAGPLGQTSDALLQKHGLTRDEYERSHYDDPRVVAALEERMAPIIKRYRDHPGLYMWGVGGEPHAGQSELSDYDRGRFGEWLRDQYSSIEALDRAWALYPVRERPVVSTFEEAWKYAAQLMTLPEGAGMEQSIMRKSYGARRDLMRYQADKELQRTEKLIELIQKYDPDHPILIGTHQLFLNQAAMRWDFGAWARLADHFETSIHLSWHFQLARGEVDRPVYMQARQTRDYFKYGWTSAFETTGGAVQYSGGYGNGMSAGLMRRLMLSYLAAGNVTMAFWTWNHRPGGWEGGEYGLTSLSGALTPWAIEAGKVARAMERYAGELWDADHDVRVGVLQSWDNEAIYTLEPERHELRDGLGEFSTGTKTQPMRAYIGVARALINHHIPYEYVTAQEISEGIALYYPALYAPHLRAASTELMEALITYVHKGGRLVADVQIGFEDQWGKLHRTGLGGLQERCFGAYVDTIHDARTMPVSVNGIVVQGFYGTLVPTTARVLARFDDGRPAITEAQIGRGTAVLIGFDAARMCWQPGQDRLEALIAASVWGGERPAWSCDAPMAFRRSSPQADHYFLLNDSDARTAWLTVYDRTYAAGEYVLEDKPIDTTGTIAIDLPARSAIWCRFT